MLHPCKALNIPESFKILGYEKFSHDCSESENDLTKSKSYYQNWFALTKSYCRCILRSDFLFF